MLNSLKSEFDIYEDIINNKKIVKESWIIKNLPLFHDFMSDKPGNSLSEKYFLLFNETGKCKVCDGFVKFLSYSRGYRIYCSKSCSNNDSELINSKKEKYKETCLKKYGFENSSSSKEVKDRIKETRSKLDISVISDKMKKSCIDKYGVDNPSKIPSIKQKKIDTNLNNWGVLNVFQSEVIKNKSKSTNLKRYGVNHPLKSKLFKNKIKLTCINKYGVDNFTKSDLHKFNQLSKYKSSIIKTTINNDLNFIEYLGNSNYILKCDNGCDHNYEIGLKLYHGRNRIMNKLCTVCYPVSELNSIKEVELLEYIKSIYSGVIISNYRDGLEIDVYLPDLKIGFEFNGLYWHSEVFKEKDYHINKTNHFKDKGIRIIHIWEDDWIFKIDIIKSQICNWIKISNHKIWGRNCDIRLINNSKMIRKFLDSNHIQGFVASSIKIGLFYKDELVSLMTFDKFEGRKKMIDGEWNLSRFCNKINFNIVGGASKLLSFFNKNYNPCRIISFADKEWSTGDLYYKLGFELKYESDPNYKYLVDMKRVNKQRFQKKKLVNMGYDINKSESEIMFDLKYYKIFDCGQLKFEFIYHNL